MREPASSFFDDIDQVYADNVQTGVAVAAAGVVAAIVQDADDRDVREDIQEADELQDGDQREDVDDGNMEVENDN